MFNNFSFIAYCLAKGFTTAMDDMVDREFRHHCHHQWKSIPRSCDYMENSYQAQTISPSSPKPMSLDEVIKYADQKAGNRETYLEKQYSQVACWLTELKWRREEDKKRLENDYAILKKEAKPIDKVFKEEEAPSRPSSNKASVPSDIYDKLAKATVDDKVAEEVMKLIKDLIEEVKKNKQNTTPSTSKPNPTKKVSEQVNSIPGFEGTITSNE